MLGTNFKMATGTIFLLAALVSGCSNGQSATAKSPSAAGTDAKNLKNPVPPTTKSIDSGKKLYSRLCADCHGSAGDGISETANVLIRSGKTAPSNLTDDVWDLGSTDGEIFMVIRDGSGSNLAMKGLNGRPGIVDEDIWNLVNYIHTLHRYPEIISG